MNISGEARILKDDRGVYKTTLVSTDSNKETGEEEKIFMKINVGFKKGVEVKNKTKINITNGFITFFRIDTGEVREDGKPDYKYFPKLVIMDFEVIEDGIDEVYSSKPKKASESNFSNDTFGGYYPDTYSEDTLPF